MTVDGERLIPAGSLLYCTKEISSGNGKTIYDAVIVDDKKNWESGEKVRIKLAY